MSATTDATKTTQQSASNVILDGKAAPVKTRKVLDPNKKMRLWVLISGLSPFCLQCVFDLDIHHYKEIVEQYYLELYA